MTALFCLAIGVVGVAAWNGDGGNFQPWAAATAVTGLAAFLILFAIYWVAWLMYGHAQWLNERQNPSAEDES